MHASESTTHDNGRRSELRGVAGGVARHRLREERCCCYAPAVVSPIVDRLRARFADDPGEIIAAYVFGSEGRGESGPNSDVDVAILLGRRPARTLAAQPYPLADELQGLLGRRVDLVVLDDAPPDLVHRVLRDGIVILDRDRSARLRFEVAARNAYFDLKPVLERYRRPAA